MYKYFILFISYFFLTFHGQAQISEGGIPPSFSFHIKSNDIEFIQLQKPDMESIWHEDDSNEAKDKPYRVGVSVPFEQSIYTTGTWQTLPNGEKLWQLHIKIPDAQALGVYFSEFHLPYGAKLFIYNPDHSMLIGAFTYKNNNKYNDFATQLIGGDEIILELVTPAKIDQSLKLTISELAYNYRNFNYFQWKEDVVRSGSCQVNINCSPEGDNWQDEKKGVARMYMKNGSNYFLCSGSLINNAKQDCTPYFLSAAHCSEDENGKMVSAEDLRKWIFYFNYEASTCDGTSGSFSQSVKGCQFRAKAKNNPGSKSDMLLLELFDNPATEYDVYYNGWDRNNTESTSGVGIHHPAGDIKKISTYTKKLANYANTHWKVYWAATSNGHGTTEGGSSGSPLFNSKGEIVGTLTGGTSGCDGDEDKPDIYGKMWYHWDQNGTHDYEQLKPWLDPDNTDVTTMSGQYCNNFPPAANIWADKQDILPGTSVSFRDVSSGEPTSWYWTFGDGTTSTTQYPSHTYTKEGNYAVSLKVTNDNGNDTEIKYNYIHVQRGPCIFLHYDNFADSTYTPTLYYSVDTEGNRNGYMSGNNSYGDLAKADYFSTSSTYNYVDSVYIWFGYASDGGHNTDVEISVWQETGDTVGNKLGSSTIPLSTIVSDVNNSQLTAVDMPNISVSTSFFVGITLPNGSGDTVAIVTNKEDESNPNTAWEQSANGSWSAYEDTWGHKMTHAIFPIVCSDDIGFETIPNTNDVLGVYPNPNNGIFELNYHSETHHHFSITLMTEDGKTIYSQSFSNNATTFEKQFDFSSLSTGIYILKLQNKTGVLNYKVIIH
jgi:PKD repeat protein